LDGKIAAAGDGPICSDAGQMLFKVKAAAGNELVGEGVMQIDKNEFRCAGNAFPLKDITRIAVVGKMTLVFALTDGTSYEVKSRAPRSAVKYREIFKKLRGAV